MSVNCLENVCPYHRLFVQRAYRERAIALRALARQLQLHTVKNLVRIGPFRAGRAV